MQAARILSAPWLVSDKVTPTGVFAIVAVPCVLENAVNPVPAIVGTDGTTAPPLDLLMPEPPICACAADAVRTNTSPKKTERSLTARFPQQTASQFRRSKPTD